MVMPTTERPSRTSIAATTELSTPPLIATAMGRSKMGTSGMHGNPAQMRYAGPDGLDKGVHLLHRVGAPQGETHARPGAIVAQPDGLQHVRWQKRAARTG